MNKLLSNILLLLVTTMVCLVFLEIGVRISGVSALYGYPDGLYENDDLLDYKIVPGISGELIKPEFKTKFKINSDGMNDREYSEKNIDDFRILALGDSFVWGAYGTELDETFLKQLEVRLNENSNGKNFQVMKAGVPGYGTDQELLYLKSRGIKLKPDMVLLHFYPNDFDDNMVSGEREVNPEGQLVVKRKSKQKPLKLFRNFLFNNLDSYRLTERTAVNIMGPKLGKLVGGDTIYNRDGISNIYEVNYTEDTNLKLERTFTLIKEMHQFTEENNIPFAIVFIPAKFQVYADLQKDIINEGSATNKAYDDFAKPNKIFLKWAEEENIVVIDLLPGLLAHDEKDDLYWTLNPHWNKKGNNKGAELIYQKLIEHQALSGLIRPESKPESKVWDPKVIFTAQDR
ncbi:MAG: SGNH/GDSL hydrolase family protein [Nanoarchaeota archaeon]|nr:SGNH/GDSL hydrolase family protein [Nanoarchaeota archaeon]